MGIRANFHRASALTLVAKGVHVADDWVADLGVAGFENRDRTHVDHLVNSRSQWNLDASHRCDARTPHAAGHHDILGIDATTVGNDGLDDAVFDDHVFDLNVGEGLQGIECLRPLTEDGASAKAVDHRHRRRVETAEQDLFVDERDHLFDLGRSDQASVNPPVLGRHHAATELFEALGGTRYFDTATRCVDAHLGVLALAVEVEHGHLAVVVNRKDEI